MQDVVALLTKGRLAIDATLAGGADEAISASDPSSFNKTELFVIRLGISMVLELNVLVFFLV